MLTVKTPAAVTRKAGPPGPARRFVSVVWGRRRARFASGRESAAHGVSCRPRPGAPFSVATGHGAPARWSALRIRSVRRWSFACVSCHLHTSW